MKHGEEARPADGAEKQGEESATEGAANPLPLLIGFVLILGLVIFYGMYSK